MTTVAGSYLPGHAPIEDLTDDLASIKNNGRVCIVGDFNTNHTAWGAPTTNARGTTVQAWMELNRLNVHNNLHLHAFILPNAQSTLDLAFTNQLTDWESHHLDYNWRGSDHCIRSGLIRAARPNTHTYKTVNWKFWEEYAEESPTFEPALTGEAHTQLAALTREHQITKTACAASKK